MKSINTFKFEKPGLLIDRDLELVLVEKMAANAEAKLVPAYVFEMRLTGTLDKVGQISLRIGNIKNIVMYAGHIGYGVEKSHRGRRYAARGVKLLFPLAKRHNLYVLWITCNPDNIASRRTCELAGGKLIEIVDLPTDNTMYLRGERQKCRYRFDL